MTNPAEKRIVSAQVDADMRGELERLAQRDDRSISSIVRRVLAAELQHAAQTAGGGRTGSPLAVDCST